MQITIADLFKMWETLDNSGPFSEPMQKAKEHLEGQLSAMILDLNLTRVPAPQA